MPEGKEGKSEKREEKLPPTNIEKPVVNDEERKRKIMIALQKENIAKRKAEELRKTLKAESPEEKNEALIKKILGEAGIYINVWAGKEQRADILTFIAEGYTDLREKFQPKYKKIGIPWGKIEEQLGAKSQDLTTGRRIFKEHQMNELIDIRHIKSSIFQTITIPGKKGFLGFGKTEDKIERKPTGKFKTLSHDEVVLDGKKEPAVQFSYCVAGKTDYYDSGKRGGKAITASFILPESTASILEQEIKENPKIMREIIETSMKEKFLKNPDAWETEKQNNTLRPPYEKWDAEPNGGRVYIQKEGNPTGWHEEYVYNVK